MSASDATDHLLGLDPAGPSDPRYTHTVGGRARQLNESERQKLRRHPFEVAGAIVERYAKDGGLEALLAEPGEVERLKWVGLYPQRQGGDAFMLRVKVPGGVLTSPQAAVIGEVATAYGEGPSDHPMFGNHYVDLTTRQAIQLHWIPLAAVPTIWARFAAVGLTTVQACGDCARNVTCCPVSGVDRNEVFDALPAARAISDFFTGNRAYANLPRKFKIAVTGCREDCARVEINDIGLWPARDATGALGFNVLVGGGLSDGERMASDIDLFVAPDQAVELCRAVAHTYAELGNREHRGLARLRYLVQELGPERFRSELMDRTDLPERPAGVELTTAQRSDHVGVHAERRDGFVSIGCAVPVGRLTGEELVEAARLAAEHGDGTLRVGVDQNLILTGIPEADVDDVVATPLLQRHSPTPGPFLRGVVACTGTEFCRYAVTETKARAVELARALDAELAAELGVEGLDRPIRIHVSGCSASCAQPQVADVGLRGAVAKVDGELAEGFDLGLGGSLGPDAGFIDWIAAAVPADRLTGAIAAVAREFATSRAPGEDFTAFVRRQSREELRAVVGATT
jgi:ferredoxin-nitrite reductase